MSQNGRSSSYSNSHSRHSSLMSYQSTDLEVKNMQSKLLMDHYVQVERKKNQKLQDERQAKRRYGQYQSSLTQDYVNNQLAKKRLKQQIKGKMSSSYQQMMENRRRNQQQQRKNIIELQRKHLAMPNWIRDSNDQKNKRKRLQQQYGKQLEKHLQLQQMKKKEQILKQRETIQKMMYQRESINQKYTLNQYENVKKFNQFQKRQNDLLGVSTLVNPQFSLPTMDYMRGLKRQQQMLVGQGLEQQLRSHTLKPKKLDQSSQYMSKSQIYNPITNPIQRNYKNPNVLRMLAEFH